MAKKTDEKIQQLQLMEQSVSTLLNQRQQFHSQLIEVDSALHELKKTEKVYKIIGNIMVAAEKAKVEKELGEKRVVLDLRISTLKKQEDQIKEKAKILQTEVLGEMKND